eukprot:TRINITY_DN602_c0_g1_i2.p1 TRINITY_DN602_c0_g1~~TRINITY_DN602_c0_g1_i2.p1  ORF type:complete len:398 (-),score=82.64 TRINITY_DN602_c0_g1_i2:313-1425(-)
MCIRDRISRDTQIGCANYTVAQGNNNKLAVCNNNDNNKDGKAVSRLPADGENGILTPEKCFELFEKEGSLERGGGAGIVGVNTGNAVGLGGIIGPEDIEIKENDDNQLFGNTVNKETNANTGSSPFSSHTNNFYPNLNGASISNSNSQINNPNCNANNNNNNNNSMVNNNERCCKICLEEETEAKNPLVTPCKCTGSLGLVHFDCLNKWLRGHVQIHNTAHVKTVIWKSLTCEICGEMFQREYKINDLYLSIFDIEKPASTVPYIYFEVISKKVKSKSKGAVLLNFNKKNVITIGKSPSISDLVLKDLSISELHAWIKIENGSVVLEDCNSQYGTFKLMKPVLKLSEKTKYACFQTGNHLYSITMENSYM